MIRSVGRAGLVNGEWNVNFGPEMNDGTALMAQDELGLEGGQAAMERNNGAQAAKRTTMMADDKARKGALHQEAAKAAKLPSQGGASKAATAAVEAAAADLAAAARRRCSPARPRLPSRSIPRRSIRAASPSSPTPRAMPS
jgi:ribonucleoside-diphosphate reductase alpha chain